MRQTVCAAAVWRRNGRAVNAQCCQVTETHVHEQCSVRLAFVHAAGCALELWVVGA